MHTENQFHSFFHHLNNTKMKHLLLMFTIATWLLAGTTNPVFPQSGAGAVVHVIAFNNQTVDITIPTELVNNGTIPPVNIIIEAPNSGYTYTQTINQRGVLQIPETLYSGTYNLQVSVGEYEMSSTFIIE